MSRRRTRACLSISHGGVRLPPLHSAQARHLRGAVKQLFAFVQDATSLRLSGLWEYTHAGGERMGAGCAYGEPLLAAVVPCPVPAAGLYCTLFK